jgi:hypothetical protein
MLAASHSARSPLRTVSSSGRTAPKKRPVRKLFRRLERSAKARISATALGATSKLAWPMSRSICTHGDSTKHTAQLDLYGVRGQNEKVEILKVNSQDRHNRGQDQKCVT